MQVAGDTVRRGVLECLREVRLPGKERTKRGSGPWVSDHSFKRAAREGEVREGTSARCRTISISPSSGNHLEGKDRKMSGFLG